jgi:hypothetical protein
MKGDRLGEFEEFTLLAVRALGDHTYAVPVLRVTPIGVKTARELHRVRERIWNAIAEGRRS